MGMALQELQLFICNSNFPQFPKTAAANCDKLLPGPKLPKDQVIIAVNWTGVYMVDDQEQVKPLWSVGNISQISINENIILFLC